MKYFILFTAFTAFTVFFTISFNRLGEKEIQPLENIDKSLDGIDMINGQPVQLIVIKKPMSISPSR